MMSPNTIKSANKRAASDLSSNPHGAEEAAVERKRLRVKEQAPGNMPQVTTVAGLFVDARDSLCMPMAIRHFESGNALMNGHLWHQAESYFTRARTLIGAHALGKYLCAREGVALHSVCSRAWLLYQSGVAELEQCTMASQRIAASRLRASQSLLPLYYPASIALGVCLVLLGQPTEAAEAVRRGIQAYARVFVTPVSASMSAAVAHVDLARLMCAVLVMRPAWPVAHLALLRATAEQPVRPTRSLSVPAELPDLAQLHLQGVNDETVDTKRNPSRHSEER